MLKSVIDKEPTSLRHGYVCSFTGAWLTTDRHQLIQTIQDLSDMFLRQHLFLDQSEMFLLTVFNHTIIDTKLDCLICLTMDMLQLIQNVQDLPDMFF
jgi:hypothetical protein